MFIELEYLHSLFSKAQLSILLILQVYIFLFIIFLLDKYDKYYIVFITEYILFEGFKIP